MTLDTTTILIVVALLAALVTLWLLLRARGRDRLEDRRHPGEPDYVASQERPYMTARQEPSDAPTGEGAVYQPGVDGPQGNGVADEYATAATDVAGDLLGVEARAELPGATATPDRLELLKGVGPKFAQRLNELGIFRFEQVAALSATEVEILDNKLGPFRGRMSRDRIVEQASYLARGDAEGFEARFGSLGPR